MSKGYDIFRFSSTDMLEVQRIDEESIFENDEQAVEQAIKDGIKIIPVEELPENFDRKYLGWIDTPENRVAINKYCSSDWSKSVVLSDRVRDTLKEEFQKAGLQWHAIYAGGFIEAGIECLIPTVLIFDTEADNFEELNIAGTYFRAIDRLGVPDHYDHVFDLNLLTNNVQVFLKYATEVL